MPTITDVESEHGINAKRSILALGITDNDTNEAISKALEAYGTVVKIARLGQDRAIIEFRSEDAVERIKPDFPCEIPTTMDPALRWCFDSIDKIIISTSLPPSTVGADPNEAASVNTLPSELSGSDSWETESEGSEISSSSKAPQKRPQPVPVTPQPNSTPPDKVTRPKKRTQSVAPATLNANLLNPPDVQRIIVEHVIKSEAPPSQSSGSKRLRSFSGRVPKPPGEVDFETWCLHVELMFQDGLPADMQRRIILESLLSPASDIVKQLGSHSSPLEYVRFLQSAYGLVDDGEEIFAKFLSTHQDAGEKSSEYLQRLQALLSTAVRRGGVSEANANKQLYKQFIRGCWDQTLLLTLQQTIKGESAPDFSELLLQLRTEEERRSVKIDRMQRHFGSSKTKPVLQFQSVPEANPKSNPDTDILHKYMTETENL
uniref:Paraneoplastic antigen Ma-like C-terminal domain-containing protein n=1 Tax=Stegastes partitus TaxID=144197 RepID=A0A3B5ABC5_9TELE